MKRGPYTTLEGLGDETVLTVADLVLILAISREKISEMLTTGKIEGMFRAGRLLRIQVRDVRKWIDSEKLPKNKFLFDLREELRERVRGSGRSRRS